MPGRPKLAYVISQYPEFHETFIAREVETLLRRGVDLRIYSLKPGPVEHFHYAHHARITVHYPALRSVSNWSALLRTIVSKPLRLASAVGLLLRFYWRRPVELAKCLAILPMTTRIAEEISFSKSDVHSHWATVPTTIAMVICKLADTHFSFTAHAWDIYLTPPSELLAKVAATRGAVTCTRFNVEHLRSLDPHNGERKVELNYHGVDFDLVDKAIEGCRPAPGAVQFVAVGRMVEQKGFEYMVQAMGLLPPGTRAHLNIIGDGPLRASLEQIARSIDPARGTVTFVGRLSQRDTLRMVASSHALIAPSVIAKDGDRDGIPNVILEAMSCHVPVLGTRVSGLPEVVIPGQTGWLVDERNAAALAAVMTEIAAQPADAERRGALARQFVKQNFDLETNCGELLSHLNRFHGISSGPDTQPAPG